MGLQEGEISFKGHLHSSQKAWKEAGWAAEQEICLSKSLISKETLKHTQFVSPSWSGVCTQRMSTGYEKSYAMITAYYTITCVSNIEIILQ